MFHNFSHKPTFSKSALNYLQKVNFVLYCLYRKYIAVNAFNALYIIRANSALLFLTIKLIILSLKMRCQVLNKDFPRIITFLRKERGLSQKQVAGDMGISQALLSHYEKGIRECGLDFLVKTAEYYGVSTDYLLGRTVQRNFTADPFEAAEKEVVINTEKGSMINKINRSLLMNTTSVIYDLLAKIGNKHLTNAVSNYLMSAEYVIFRTIYNSEKNNSQTMFSLDKNRYRNLTDASMILDLEIINELIENDKLTLTLSPDVISVCFEKDAPSLFNLIQYSERNIKNVYAGKR